MKKDVKNEILKTGMRLFREQGYANVSMRNIADALGMSVGNLTYHFKRKEELIESVIYAQLESFEPPPTPTTIKQLDEFFSRGVEEQKGDDYFLRYYDELATISPKIYAIQVEAIKTRKKKLYDAFDILEQKGLMKPEEFPGQRDAIIDVINIIKIYWTPSQEALSSALESPINCLRSIIYGLLTDKGKKDYCIELRSCSIKTREQIK